MEFGCCADELYGILHALERCSHKRRQTDHRDVLLNGGVDNKLRVDVSAQIDYGVAVVVEQHLYYVFAYVVDVALDSGKDYFALADLFAARLAEVLFDNVKARLSGVGALNELRQEYLVLFKILAHLVERGDKRVVYDIHCVFFGEHSLGSRSALVFQSAVNRGFNAHGLLPSLGLWRRSGSVVALDKLNRIFVDTRKHPVGAHRAGHRVDVGVDDRQVKPFFKRHCQEGAVYKLAVRQSERNI